MPPRRVQQPRRFVVNSTTVEVEGIRMGYIAAFSYFTLGAVVFALCVSLLFRIFRIREEAHLSAVRLEPRGFTGRGMCWLFSVVGAVTLTTMWQLSIALYSGGPREIMGVMYSAGQL